MLAWNRRSMEAARAPRVSIFPLLQCGARIRDEGIPLSSGFNTDVLIIGGGPAGSATAIWLARAGLQVVMVEQHEFPRQKVCGECISAAGLTALDELGVGSDLHPTAGPELRQVAWMGSAKTVVASFPRCESGTHAYGRAIGRDKLDSVLLAKARSLGVCVLQPAKVQSVAGDPGHFLCTVEVTVESIGQGGGRRPLTQMWEAGIVIDAHGSWEQAPKLASNERLDDLDRRRVRDSDLFAFKACFSGTSLQEGVLPVVGFPGGYGGIVVADRGRTTLACCIRRDALHQVRVRHSGQRAGLAVAALLQRSCPGLAEALTSSQQEMAWLSVGPIRPGIRVDRGGGIIRVGNAAGEAHPLIGEGINMALQSAKLAAAHVSRLAPTTMTASKWQAANRAYAAEWRMAFRFRLRYASLYAHLAMRPALANPLAWLLQAQPSLMTHAASWAGKARGVVA